MTFTTYYYENGTIQEIDEFPSLILARKAVQKYYEDDKANDCFNDGCYGVVPTAEKDTANAKDGLQSYIEPAKQNQAETILDTLQGILNRNSITSVAVSNEPMDKGEYNALVNKWELSAGLLAKLLDKSLETVRSYRSRRNYPIPLDVAVKLRKIDIIFTDFSNL